MTRRFGKKLLAILVITVVSSLAIPLSLANTPPSPPPQIPSQCTAYLPSGWSTTPIINAKMNVLNDEDSGNVGYWALDQYVKGFIIWENPTTSPPTFCALDVYNGHWQTFAGALSPQNGVTEGSDQSGKLIGGLVLIFTATFPRTGGNTKPLTGNIGTFDFGGTKSNVLLGTYTPQGSSNPDCQCPDTTYIDFTSFYFSPQSTPCTTRSITDQPRASSPSCPALSLCPPNASPGPACFNEPFAFTYSEDGAVSYGTMWINANTPGNAFGDIVSRSGPAPCPATGDQTNSKQQQHAELCEEKAGHDEQENGQTEQGTEQAEQNQQNTDNSGEDLNNADFKGYDFSNSNLKGADLSGSILQGANLAGADLTCASLAGADLSGANLAGAILDGADLTGTNLQGVDLTTVISSIGFAGCP